MIDNNQSKLNKLANLLKDRQAFDSINEYTSNFNVFTTLGIKNNELKHSNMLAFLLNPDEKHGLDDELIKYLLNYYIEQFPPNKEVISLLLKDFKDAYILREYKHIDLLIVSEASKIIIAIENKIWSSESNDQLNRYQETLRNDFPINEYNHYYFFLSPYGSEATNNDWYNISYSEIINFIEKSLVTKKDSINDFMESFINQYLDLLRRYIVGDKELEGLCREIYSKHRDALDLIFEYKPDIYSDVSDHLQNFISNNEDLYLDGSGKKFIRFLPKSLNTEIIKCGEGWTDSKNIILFELDNYNNRLAISLVLGPGDEQFRTSIYEFAKQSKYLNPKNVLSNQYSKLTKLHYLIKNYDNVAPEALPEKCVQAFIKYLDNDMKNIIAELEIFLREYRSKFPK